MDGEKLAEMGAAADREYAGPDTVLPSPDPRLPHYYNNLAATLDTAFGALRIGAANRRSAFHTFAVATVREDGSPSLRTVVLRAFRAPQRTITFHTDVRSRKHAELSANPRFAALFYDPGAKIQLRLDCVAEVYTGDAESLDCWRRSRPMSRECYGQAEPPGKALADPLAAEADWLSDDGAFSNFAVVTGRIVHLEWLYLAAAGHRRAAFDWTSGSLQQTWLAP